QKQEAGAAISTAAELTKEIDLITDLMLPLHIKRSDLYADVRMMIAAEQLENVFEHLGAEDCSITNVNFFKSPEVLEENNMGPQFIHEYLNPVRREVQLRTPGPASAVQVDSPQTIAPTENIVRRTQKEIAMSTTRKTPARGRSLSVSATSRRQPRKPPSFISKSFLHRTSFKFDPPQATNSARRTPQIFSPPARLYLNTNPSLLPPSLEPLDIPATATHFSLDGLRDAFLSNLSDLQARLSRLAEESKAEEGPEQELDSVISPSDIEDILEE
ncbi:hypothetical protein FRC00_008229, partial [Tulasnella sp. 408]